MDGLGNGGGGFEGVKIGGFCVDFGQRGGEYTGCKILFG